jgi:hypothetical protein
MIQSGEGDWIINSHPSGTDTGCVSWLQGRRKCMFWQKESFLFGGLSPPNRKMTSLRPWRLCGEIPILDKSDNKRHFAKIHYDWMKLKKFHAGMILSDQLTIGVVLRRLMRLYFSVDSDEMRTGLSI